MNWKHPLLLAVLALSALLLVAGAAEEDLPLPKPAQAEPPLPPSFPSLPPASFDAPPMAPPATLPVAPVRPQASTAPLSSTSSSGQFIVYGPDLRVRSGIAAKCEEISQELGRLLRNTDPWVLTIVVQIKPLTLADPADLGITTQVSALTHGGFHLQLNVPERSGLRPADFRREAVRLLLTERVLRPHKRLPDGKSAELVPPWVLTGALKAMDYRIRGRPSAEFAAIFKSGKIYGIEEILDAKPEVLDALSRTIYETSSCALVMAVVDQPEGPLRFGRFLASLAQEEKPQSELLKQWFPGLAESDSSLDKWWSLQLAALASPGMAETLDPAQTVELLDRALTFHLPAGEGKNLPSPKVVASIASQRPRPLEPPTAPVAGTPAEDPEDAKKPASKSSKPAAKTVSSRPKDLPPAPADEGEDEQDKSGRGFLKSVFSFKLMGGDKAEEPTEASESAAKETSKAADKPAAPAAKSEDKDKEPPKETKAETKTETKTETAKKEEPPKKPEPDKAKAKPAKAEEAPAAEEDRGSKLNPLNWFRGGKDKGKEEESKEKPPEPAKEGKKGAAKGALLAPPAAAAAYAWFTLEEPRPQATERLIVRDLLGNARGRYIQAAAKPTAPPPPIREKAELLAPPAPTADLPPATALAESGPAFPIENYAEVLAHPQRAQLLARARLALQDTAIRGYALFREIAGEYVKVIDDLEAGKVKDMDKRLKDLRKRAVDTYKQACAVQEHLDWYEATQSTRYSGLFDDFITLPARIKEELPPRTDPISKYLDAVEAEMGR